MRFRMISAALGLAAAIGFAAPALANHNHPSKANKFLSLYVKAYNQCTGGSLTHNAPLAFPACTPVRVSDVLVFGPKGFGQSKGVVLLNSLKQATDVALSSKFVDVRYGNQVSCSKDNTTSCTVDADCNPPVTTSKKGFCLATPFDGVLQVAGVIRSTDHFCATPGECTLVDTPFPVNVPCGANASPALPNGKCLAATSANGALAGAVTPGHQANVELQQLQVYANGELNFTEGLYLP